MAGEVAGFDTYLRGAGGEQACVGASVECKKVLRREVGRSGRWRWRWSCRLALFTCLT